MMRLRLGLAAALAALPASAQQAAVRLPPSDVAARAVAERAVPLGRRPLDPAVVEQALPKMAADDFQGFGAEAARALAWAAGKKGLYLLTDPPRLAARGAKTFPLSAPLAGALRHVDGYFAMTPATLARPVTFAELSAAAASREGVTRAAELFEGMIADRLRAPSGVVVPEVGGEATFDGRLRLREFPDLTRPVLRQLARDQEDLDAVRRLYAAHPEEMKALDENGLLKRLLDSLPAWEARGVPAAQRERAVRATLEAVIANTSDSYLFDPQGQFAAIAAQEWSGRYVGRWHTHPPHKGAAGWEASEGPSGPDMDIAVKTGQNLVLAFHPEGFDLYDLSPLSDAGRADLALVRKVSYRSPAWRARFQALYDRLFTSP